MQRRTVLVYLLFVAFLVVGGILYQEGLLRLNYPDPDRFPVRGIDVSHHQGTIEWDAVRKSGIRFAYIKASEGATWRDPLFTENWHGAGQAGIAWGAYHYFSFCSSGLRQAENFIDAVATAKAAPDLPLAVDLETEGNCQVEEGVDRLREELAAFLERVERSCHCRPLLYVTSETWLRIVRGYFQDYPIWVRDVGAEPSQMEYGQWMFWQYAENGRVPGVATLADLDLFNDTWEEFDFLVKHGNEWISSSGSSDIP